MTINTPTLAMKEFTDNNGIVYSDTYLDANKNIALLFGVDAIAQTVKNAIQLWLREYQFNNTIGIPWTEILGQTQNVLLINSYISEAVLSVTYVTRILSINYVPDTKTRSLSITVKYLNSDNVEGTSNANI